MAEPFDLGALVKTACLADPKTWEAHVGPAGRTIDDPWEVRAPIDDAHIRSLGICTMGDLRDDEANAKHIAACSPDRLLALHAQLVAIRQAIVAETDWRDTYGTDLGATYRRGRRHGAETILEAFDRRVSLDVREGEEQHGSVVP